jgi:hypothetical protein
MGAVLKVFFNSRAATKATGCGRICPGSINLTAFSGKMTASSTLDQGRTLTHPENGYKKQGKIIIHTDKIGLAQPAVGADTRLLVKLYLSRAYATDQKHLN